MMGLHASGTENSTAETKARSAALANDIGSYHLSTAIDSVVSAFLTLVSTLTGKTPKFKVFGGSVTENLALQNIQVSSFMKVPFEQQRLMCLILDFKLSFSDYNIFHLFLNLLNIRPVLAWC